MSTTSFPDRRIICCPICHSHAHPDRSHPDSASYCASGLAPLSINSTVSLGHRSCTQGVKLRYAMTKQLICSLRVRDHLKSSGSHWFEGLPSTTNRLTKPS